MKNKQIKSGIMVIVFVFMLVLGLFAGQGFRLIKASTSRIIPKSPTTIQLMLFR